MTGHTAMTTAPRRGVLRLVVLAVTLAGFVTMHGLAAAATGGAHCGSPAALLQSSDAHGPTPQPAHHDNSPTGGEHGTWVDPPAPSHSSDESMVGCLLALLGTLVAIGLHLLGGRSALIVSAVARRSLAWLRTARGPPDPLFLSLCVFRL